MPATSSFVAMVDFMLSSVLVRFMMASSIVVEELSVGAVDVDADVDDVASDP